MRTRRLVLLLCLLCLAGAWFFRQQSANPRKPSALPKAGAPAANPAVNAPNSLAAAATNGVTSAKTNQFAYRLSNTTKSLDQLVGDRHAILLENALIDASRPLNFSIPTHLQSQGDPGAYIVQARGPIDAEFRAMLAAAGAEIVSYIPNDAYLVRAPAGVANGLADNLLTQAVTPYEPYYKIQSSLLTLAVGQMDLPDGTVLTLGLFTATAPQTIREIEKLGGKVLAQDHSPFGPVVRVQPPQNWTALATLPGVQIVEPYHPRGRANDLSRVATGVAADTLVPTNYLNLNGLNVIVEVNDFGIDATHPDLAGRVFGSPTTDTSGHGTHVAGIIAGNGSMSSTVTNAPGSIMPGTNGQFRGMAPLANLLSMDWNASDRELQEAAARTNALISNNGWNYGNSGYDLAAASYDAAVRDALPLVTGSQPVLFVFAAGNNGGGDDSNDPGGGNPDTILSPATAKNVITVGALQEFRNITNVVTTISADGVTNTSTPWQPETSTSYRMAGFSSRGNVGIGIEGTYGRYKPDVVAPGTFVLSTRSEQWDVASYFYINPTNHDVNRFGNLVLQPGGFWANVFPIVPANAVQAAIYVEPNADSPVPFPDLTVYFGLASAAAYTFNTANNQVLIPPDGGLTIADILNTESFYGFNYAVSNTTTQPISFDVFTDVVTTNNPGDYFLVLSNLNQSIGTFNPGNTSPGPYYRYESGTSMSAAGVSGVLALMQQFFTDPSFGIGLTPSPALLKGMLINGARATGFYNFHPQNPINYEGWGLINLPNSLPIGVTTNLAAGGESMLIIDQNPTTALATGDSHRYQVTIVNTSALALPLRITLAWTDPPGDPAAAIKLVNDLNLVVSNSDAGVVYYGNDIPASSTFNSAQNSTNAPNYDAINNVENVYLQPGSGTNFSVTVLGYRVNVNAVTAQSNNVVQDFALVISSGNGEAMNAFTVTDIGPGLGIVSNPMTDQQITFVTSTNKPLLNQLAGASTPLLGTNTIPLGTNLVWGGSNGLVTLGMTNQWHFYVVTNTTGFTNAAFVTFNPHAPNPDTLSVPRMGVFADSVGNATRSEADIDLYVTTDPTLMNLNPVAISNCVNGAQVGASSGNIFNGASLGRGDTEFVVDTNSSPSIPGEVYYVGVYSEDREAAEYGFIPIFSQQPFSQMNPNGSQSVFGVPLPVDIPDGSPAHPGSGYVFGLALYPMQVQQVVVTSFIAHQNFGDLIGTLTHGGNNGLSGSIVLNNHDSLYNSSGIYTQIYDDSGQGDIAGSRPSDGPGSLNTFTGQQGNGVWLLTEVDDSLTQIGSVTGFNMLVEPHQDLTAGINGTVCGNQWFYEYIDVPAGATNLTISATNLTTPPLPIFLFVNTNTEPTLTNFIAMTGLTNTGPLGSGNSISIGPPLKPGRYWVGLWNPNNPAAPCQNFYLIAKINMGAVPAGTFTSSGPTPILDDAVVTNTLFVTTPEIISSVDVGLRVDHPRVSDLVFHLVSPDGTRSLLVENRGGTTTNGMGQTIAITNITPVSSSGGPLPTTNVVNVAQTSGTLVITYDFYQVPDQMRVFDSVPNLIFDSGMISGSGMFNIPYTGTSALTIVMNPLGNTNSTTLWDYTVKSSVAYNTYLVLTENTNKTTIPIKYAPTPYHGATTTNVTYITNKTTTTTYTTNYVPVTNAAVGWHSSFEGNPQIEPGAGSYISEGWHVDSGDIDVLLNGYMGSTAFEGTAYIDINGTTSGTISTNVSILEAGQTYQLSLACAQNPDRRGTETVQLQTNGSPLLTLTLNNTTNTWAGLGWATTSRLFTATAPSTTFTFASQTPGVSSVLLDAIDLAPLSGFNGFERAAAADYSQGHYFDGWYVANNQVTVISNAALAYEYGNSTNLLALADGTISRILPTMPGQIYTLTYAYRGPAAVGLWRGENNPNDDINGNNGTVSAGSVEYVPAEVRQGFSFDGGNNEVTVPDAPQLNFGANQDFSIDVWIQPLANPGNWHDIMILVDKRVAPDLITQLGYALFLQSGEVWFQMADVLAPYSFNNFYSGGPDLRDGQFHHVAVTVRRNSMSGGQFYIDGQMVSTFDPTICPGDLSNTGPFRIGNHAVSDIPDFYNGIMDEVSLYRRALSPSEIQAIYQNGDAGKYDTNAPAGIAQGLAKALVGVGTNAYLTFYGNNTNWQTTNITFVATQTNTILQVAGLEPGMLLDSFALTNVVILTNTTTTTNITTNTIVSGGDVYYLPEASLDPYTGKNAYGPWSLEIWDNRAGAGLTNTLVSWQLRFTFANAVPFNPITVLTNMVPVTNNIPPGGMEYYLVQVPTNADWATNRLLFPSGPLNVWFNSAKLPVGTNPPDYLLLPNSTGGSSILGLATTPTNIVPGGYYYLGVQNPSTTTSVHYGIEVDFHFLFPPSFPPIARQTINEMTLMTVTNTATSAFRPLTYTLTSTVTGPNVPVIDPLTGIITWTPDETQGPGGPYTIQTIVTDSSVPTPLSATNSFDVIVIEVNLPPYFLGTPSNQIINAYTTLTVTNAAGDPDIPANTLTYSLVNPPIGMAIDNNGVITWTPTYAQISTTNLITSVVTDYSAWALVNKSLSATNYFYVNVTGVLLSPYAFTQPATSVTGTSAQLNGMATPNGPPSVAWFEWGTSTGYGNQTPPVSVGGGFNVVYVTNQISGLLMHQPYHFRLVVSNLLGVVRGFDQIFDEAGVVAWGADYLGQTNVPPVCLSNMVAIAAAYDHSLSLKNDGTVVAWGDGTENQTNVPPGLNNAVAVAGGQFYSMAMLNTRTVRSWGANLVPGQTNVPPGLTNVVYIAGGGWSSLALRSNGRVVAWGYNIAGLTNVPAGLSNVVSVTGGNFHNLALKNDGTVAAWGDNAAGQTDVPPGLSNVVAIAGGGFHSLALKYDGTVVAWGNDDNGQTDVPAGLSNVVAVAAGGFHSLVLKNDGSVLAWGNNSSNQTTIPIGLSNVVAISSGYFHNLALASPFNVNLTNTPPFFMETNLPPQTVDELTTLVVTNTASDSDLPPQTLTYTVTMVVDTNAMNLNGWPLTYATTNPSPVIDTNGVITWPPSEAQGPGVYIITTVVTDNGIPPLSATNSFIVTVNEVNTPPFWPPNVPSQPSYTINDLSTLTVMNTATDTDIPPNPLTYQLSGPTNALIDANGVITWTPALAQAGTTNTFTTIVTDTNVFALVNRSLSATNSFTVIVNTLITLTDGQPLTNTVGPGGITYYVVNVPANADFATNILLFATGPLNIWFDTNNPPTTNILLLPDTTYPSGTNGSVMLSASTAPRLVPGATYYLGVQNPNGVPVTYGIEVDFHLLIPVPPPTNTIFISSITPTNIGGWNGFLLQWQGPTNFQYEIQWTASLAPLVWTPVLNPTINEIVTPTNGQFSFFDDGLLTGGLGNLRFYRILGSPNLGLIPGSVPVTNTVLAGAMSEAVVTVPPNAISATNVLITATGPLNVWFNQNIPPTGNVGAGDQWLLNVSFPVFVLASNSVPPLVPGTNYYLGFQNLGASDVTFVFDVTFGFPPPSPLSISSITLTTNGFFQLQWTAPTNYQFQVEWTTNLQTLPIVWNYIPPGPPYITSTNVTFTFVDTNPAVEMKFYRLIQQYP